jgi:hypothetical protein
MNAITHIFSNLMGYLGNRNGPDHSRWLTGNNRSRIKIRMVAQWMIFSAWLRNSLSKLEIVVGAALRGRPSVEMWRGVATEGHPYNDSSATC